MRKRFLIFVLKFFFMVEFIMPDWKPGTWETPIHGVYKMTIDGKYFYVGSSVHLRRRIGQWKGLILEKYKKGRYSPSVKKVLTESSKIVFEIIEFTKKEDVRIREDFYLKQHIGNPDFINQSPSATDNFGYKIVDDNGKHPKPYTVRKYDMNGNLVCTYRSLQRCVDEEGCFISSIQRCLSGERKSFHGFVFKADGYPQFVPKIKPKGTWKRRSVAQYSKSGELVAIHKTKADAARSVGCGGTTIVDNLSGRIKTVKGYVFKYAS